MYKIKWLFLIALLLFPYSVVASQTVPKSTITKAATQCKWIGTIHRTDYYNGITEILDGTVTFAYDTTYDDDVWYKLTGGNLTWSASGTYQDCEITGGPLNFDVLATDILGGSLIFRSWGTYDGGGGFDKLAFGDPLITYTCTSPPRVFTVGPTLQGFFIGGRAEDTVKSSGFISGSIDSSNLPFSSYSYQWDLHQESGDTKLSVESDEYDNWLPTAGKNEKEIGKPITFRAKLLEADGTTACAIADSFKFDLINVSHEPGVALNFPDENKAEKDWDLHFIQEFNSPTDVMSADRLSLTTEGGSDAVVFIPSFDWGAYASLKVSAFIHGGKIITGFLKGHPEITEIPIPKRSGTSKIADKWKKDKNVEALNDDDDAEVEPKGDKDLGDGFTLYEEYRGFYENGKHIFGDPKKKDLFIYTSLQDFIPGIQLFKALTKLNVHYRLTENEFDTKERKINFNYFEAPHQNFFQHGLWVKQIDIGSSFTPALGPPKRIDSVNISKTANVNTIFLMDNGRIELRPNLIRTVAHELGHAVRIDHHGPDIDQMENSYKSISVINLANNTQYYRIIENGKDTIDTRLENNKPYTESFPTKAYIGVWGGQHSGFEDCIMKYHVSFAYIPGPNTTSNVRYVTFENERAGMTLCATKEGTGVNNKDRKPRPRYGPAASGEHGDCASQICVNDKYH